MTRRTILNAGLPKRLNFGSLELDAFAVSGLASYVLAPALDACFDLGHCGVEASRLRHVFLSHTHQDHAGAVARHLSLRAMNSARPSRLYCPVESAPALVDLLHAWERLEGREPSDLSAVVHGLAPGDEVTLGRRFTVRCFEAVHRLASLAYTVIEHRRALRPEYRELPGAEVHAAAMRGEIVSDTVDHALLTYVGDSTIETLRRHPEVGASEVLFVEATHMLTTDRAASARWGHTHLDELVELWRAHPETLASRHVVLKHFSMKYTADEIARAHAALPAGLRERVTMLVGG